MSIAGLRSPIRSSLSQDGPGQDGPGPTGWLRIGVLLTLVAFGVCLLDLGHEHAEADFADDEHCGLCLVQQITSEPAASAEPESPTPTRSEAFSGEAHGSLSTAQAPCPPLRGPPHR